jgi:predicted nucleic acid-binding protein
LTWVGSGHTLAKNFMKDKFFVDTNILVYAHDLSAGAKHQRAQKLIEQLWDTRLGVVSTQVLQELCVSLQRKTAHPPTAKEVRALIEDYLTWEVVTNTGASVLEALDIAERYRLSFWDALILQASESAGASIVLSEDLSDGQKYGSVRVVNPFLNPGIVISS